MICLHSKRLRLGEVRRLVAPFLAAIGWLIQSTGIDLAKFLPKVRRDFRLSFNPEQCLKARVMLRMRRFSGCGASCAGYPHRHQSRSRYRLEAFSELPEDFVRIYEKPGRTSAGRVQSNAERVVVAARAMCLRRPALSLQMDQPGVKLRKPE